MQYIKTAFDRFAKNTKTLFGEDFNDFRFVLRFEDELPFFRALEQEAYFCEELKMRTGFVYRRKRHDKDTARLLIERIEIDGIVGNADARDEVAHRVRFSVRDRDAVLHAGRHLALAVEYAFAGVRFIRNFTGLYEQVEHFVDDRFLCRSLEMEIYGIGR